MSVGEFGHEQERGRVRTVADVEEHAKRFAANYSSGHRVTLRQSANVGAAKGRRFHWVRELNRLSLR